MKACSVVTRYQQGSASHNIEHNSAEYSTVEQSTIEQGSDQQNSVQKNAIQQTGAKEIGAVKNGLVQDRDQGQVRWGAVTMDGATHSNIQHSAKVHMVMYGGHTVRSNVDCFTVAQIDRSIRQQNSQAEDNSCRNTAVQQWSSDKENIERNVIVHCGKQYWRTSPGNHMEGSAPTAGAGQGSRLVHGGLTRSSIELHDSKHGRFRTKRDAIQPGKTVHSNAEQYATRHDDGDQNRTPCYSIGQDNSQRPSVGQHNNYRVNTDGNRLKNTGDPPGLFPADPMTHHPQVKFPILPW